MNDILNKVISLGKRRGFIFPSSEIYGGFESGYDYGPLGVELKNNLKNQWWQEMTRKQNNIAGLDAAILMSPKVWQASGHLAAGFADELVECKECHKRFRADEATSRRCSDCGGELTVPRKFNLMMKTFTGPVEKEAAVTYLRAETCQGIYLNYQNVYQSMRLKIPFGIAQIGKAFRNEITPRYFIFKTREFEQMEMQFFVSPEQKEKDKWFDFWQKARRDWYLDLGLRKENLRFQVHKKDELAHYAKRAVDIQYRFPWGWGEIEGIHDRGDWDLANHSKHSGKDLSYFDENSPTGKNQRFIPHIIETSAGADRGLLAFFFDAYQEVEGGRTTTTEAVKEKEILLKFNRRLAPVKAAVLPLVKKETLTKLAREIFNSLRIEFSIQYDEIGSIGRRYRRQDEIGTVAAITVDFQSLEDKTVTLRNRDTMNQERIKIENLKETLKEQLMS